MTDSVAFNVAFNVAIIVYRANATGVQLLTTICSLLMWKHLGHTTTPASVLQTLTRYFSMMKLTTGLAYDVRIQNADGGKLF